MAKPTKQEFANLMNRFLGQEIMDDQKLDKILQEAKMAYQEQGMNGIFSYMRAITGAPVSNEKMDEILQMLLKGGPDQAWRDLNSKYMGKQGKASRQKKKWPYRSKGWRKD